MGELRRITERYRLDRRIETPESSSVFQGTEIRTGDAVAVKLLEGGDSDAERERYAAYAAALGALAHPGLPRFVDAGFTAAGSAYLVTGYLQGSPLATAAGAPPTRILSLLLLVAEALEALAEAGWAHGNLQLENLFVVPEPVGEQVKLLGLGTPVFRPGVDLAAAAGYRGDLHDLALVACQLFLATPPAAGGTEEVRLPAEVAHGIEDVQGLSQVLDDALRGDPAGRIPSYAELRRLLRLALPDLGLRTAEVRFPSGTAPGLAPPPQAPGAGGWREVRLGAELAALPSTALPGTGTVAEGSVPSETMILERLTDGAAPAPPPVPSSAPDAPFERTRVLRMGDIPPTDPRRGNRMGPGAARPPASAEPPAAAPEAPPASTAIRPAPPIPQPRQEEPAPASLGATVRLSRADLAAQVAAAPPPPVETQRQAIPPPLPVAVPEPPSRPLPPPAPVAPVPPEPPPLTTPQAPRTPIWKQTSPLHPVAVPAPPAPVAPTAAPSAAPAKTRTPRRPAPPGRQRLWLLLGGSAAALLLLAVVGVIAFESRRQPAKPHRPVAVVPKPPKPSPPVAVQPAPLPPAIHPQILLAEGQLVGGDLAGAKTTLTAIPEDQKARFTPEENDRYQKALATLAPFEAEKMAGRLSQDLGAGDLKALKADVAALAAEPESGLAPEVRKDLTRARKLLDADGRLTRAERAREPLEILRQAGLLLAELPKSSHAREAREKVAADIEADADKKAEDGDFDAALSRLQPLRDAWPERRGLTDRVSRFQAEKRADQALDERLAAATRAEQQGKPLDGLAALKGTDPNRRYADRFRQARERLEAQFANLDRKPPEVVAPKSLKDLAYAKGAVILIPLRITDDYEVKSVEAWVRPKGGSYVHLPVRQVSGSDYELEILPGLHDNKEVDFYVTATDRSGHEGHFGTASAPKQVKRKWWSF